MNIVRFFIANAILHVISIFFDKIACVTFIFSQTSIVHLLHVVDGTSNKVSASCLDSRVSNLILPCCSVLYIMKLLNSICHPSFTPHPRLHSPVHFSLPTSTIPSIFPPLPPTFLTPQILSSHPSSVYLPYTFNSHSSPQIYHPTSPSRLYHFSLPTSPVPSTSLILSCMSVSLHSIQ